MTRAALEAEWLHLTRVALPDLASARDWPVGADHCFQRILLDNACEGRWYDHIQGRPAYRHAPDAILTRAVALGRAAVVGAADMPVLNDRSLWWRGKTTRKLLHHGSVGSNGPFTSADVAITR